MINIYEHLNVHLNVERKSQSPCGILFLHLAQKQVRIWGHCILSIVGFRSPNFEQRNILVYWNRINQHCGFWEKKYWELEFQPLGNESSSFNMNQQNWMVSYTCKDNILSPERLAYWSRWLEVQPKTQIRFPAGWSSGRKVLLGRKLQILLFYIFKKLEILIQVLI